jgi:hypothetical protein
MYLYLLHFTVTVLENPVTSQMCVSVSVCLVDSLLLFINRPSSPSYFTYAVTQTGHLCYHERKQGTVSKRLLSAVVKQGITRSSDDLRLLLSIELLLRVVRRI